jgi:ribosome-associated protein
MTRTTQTKPSKKATKASGRSAPVARRQTAEPNAQASTEGLDGAMRALSLALDKKALEPVLLDVRQLCSFCNYQLVLSGRSDRQVDAISEGIVVGLKKEGIRAIGTEGKRSGQWALLDFGDFVVHVFHHPQREHFDLEGLWVDAPRVELDIPADARIQADEY